MNLFFNWCSTHKCDCITCLYEGGEYSSFAMYEDCSHTILCLLLQLELRVCFFVLLATKMTDTLLSDIILFYGCD